MEGHVQHRSEYNKIYHAGNYLVHVPLHCHVQVGTRRMSLVGFAAKGYAVISLWAKPHVHAKCYVVPCCERGMSHAVGALTQLRVRTPCRGYRNVA